MKDPLRLNYDTVRTLLMSGAVTVASAMWKGKDRRGDRHSPDMSRVRTRMS